MKKLYRSRRDKKLFGLCGGIAEMLNVDATLLRILLIVITVFTSGFVILVYILAGLVVPKEPNIYDGFGPSGFGPGPGSFGGGWQSGGQGSHTNYGQSYNPGGPYTSPPPGGQGPATGGSWQHSQSASNLDAMMDDLEKKALRREIEELKAKLAKHEKGDF